MGRRLISKGSISILFVLVVPMMCLGQLPKPTATESTIPRQYQSYIRMVDSAIADEMAVGTSVQASREYGVGAAGQISLNLNVLVAPFMPRASGFSTHVIYLVPGYGYVIRQVSVYPQQKLALFWLGYSSEGPGTNTGFNCTHSHSNCKIEDIPFTDLSGAFCSWWLTRVEVKIGNLAMARGAKQRNTERMKIIKRSMAVASQ